MGVLFDLLIILFGHDCGMCVCVCVLVYVRGTLMVFHVAGRFEKSHKSKQDEGALGKGESLMSCWRRISVFHVERCEVRGKVTANKINVQHKQAKRIMRRLMR